MVGVFVSVQSVRIGRVFGRSGANEGAVGRWNPRLGKRLEFLPGALHLRVLAGEDVVFLQDDGEWLQRHLLAVVEVLGADAKEIRLGAHAADVVEEAARGFDAEGEDVHVFFIFWTCWFGLRPGTEVVS